MARVSFVILNYKAYREAMACADSVLALRGAREPGGDVSIVIVDNGSKNGSARALRERYAGRENVAVVASEKNLGFARGNNLGISYARRHFDPDFVVAANSDILFLQEDFCERVEGAYERRPFAILGGDVVDLEGGQHFNPVAEGREYTIRYMQKMVAISYAKAGAYRAARALLRCSPARRGGTKATREVGGAPGGARKKGKRAMREVGGELGGARGKGAVSQVGGTPGGARGKGERANARATREVGGRSVSAESLVGEEREGVLLHGCCLVFSRDFFKEMDGFWEGTFLYAEEEILYYLATRRGLRIVYDPGVRCVHKEAATVRSIARGPADEKAFYYAHVAESYRRFLALMRREEGHGSGKG